MDKNLSKRIKEIVGLERQPKNENIAHYILETGRIDMEKRNDKTIYRTRQENREKAIVMEAVRTKAKEKGITEEQFPQWAEDNFGLVIALASISTAELKNCFSTKPNFDSKKKNNRPYLNRLMMKALGCNQKYIDKYLKAFILLEDDNSFKGKCKNVIEWTNEAVEFFDEFKDYKIPTQYYIEFEKARRKAKLNGWNNNEKN